MRRKQMAKKRKSRKSAKAKASVRSQKRAPKRARPRTRTEATKSSNGRKATRASAARRKAGGRSPSPRSAPPADHHEPRRHQQDPPVMRSEELINLDLDAGEALALQSSDLPPFAVVGIGASAGGLEAFTQVLQNLPQQVDFALVLVQHLSPDRQSFLPELLGVSSPVPVVHAA